MIGVIPALLLAAGGCTTPEGRPDDPRVGPEPIVETAPATLRRLTRAEYEASLADVFGAGLVLPPYLEPDVEIEGLFAVGAGQAALSPYGVEQYEGAAYLVAQQLLAPPFRERLGCDPADRGCAAELASRLGRRLWRRTLDADELATIDAVADAAVEALDDPEAGAEFALATLLQSPHFLYRVELGEGGAFTGPELATRTAYLLWGGPPDDELLDLAEAGDLADPEVRRAQAERMSADARARRGVRAMFHEILGLQGLASLNKDPTVFVHASPEIGTSAREETLSLVERLWERDQDLRDLVLERTTRIDRTLAALYEVQAPAREGFGEVELAADGPRAGLLGQASFLALAAHPVSTSVTRRGMYVRERLLCQDLPSPPANVDTSIPEQSPDTPTMRERVALHLEDPTCAACHRLSDPIGLALEHFDGIGRYRPDDQGYPIDASGDLDGATFDGLGGLAWAVHDHPDFSRCLVEQTVKFAQGHPLGDGEDELVNWMDAGLAAHDWSLRGLLVDLVASDTFAVAQEAP